MDVEKEFFKNIMEKFLDLKIRLVNGYNKVEGKEGISLKNIIKSFLAIFISIKNEKRNIFSIYKVMIE